MSESLTVNNAETYHTNSAVDQTYTLNGNQSGRPIYQYSKKAAIKWDEFKLGEFDQMAWIVMNIKKNTTRFVSFTDVYDPRLAEDWKYLFPVYNRDLNNEMKLMNASDFYLA